MMTTVNNMDKVLIWSNTRKAYRKSTGNGFTLNKSEAGKYPRDIAEDIVAHLTSDNYEIREIVEEPVSSWRDIINQCRDQGISTNNLIKELEQTYYPPIKRQPK